MDKSGVLPAVGSDDAVTESVLVDTGDIVKASLARLNNISGLKHRFAVIRMWPEQAVAEHENVERLRDAARLLGVELIELDKFGHILGSPSEKVSSEHVDFVVHLHFETAKTYDAVSVAAMWNPTQFYFDWGFQRFWANQMSHDVFAYTGSNEIRTLVRAARGDVVAADMPVLNHTLAEPVYAPVARSKNQVFYCGINWEKVSGKKGRHDEVLKSLDSAGKLDVYGPEVVQGVKVWDGFRGYKGSLPFDGRTVIKRISQAGVCLVFSSDAHKASDIMSNRLFEALCGGAVIIGDEHPFIRKAVGDNYICVPDNLTAQERSRIILDALAKFDADPQSACRLALAAQDHFLKTFHLSAQLVNVYESVQRFNERNKKALETIASPVLDFVIQPISGDADEIVARINALKAGFGNRANLILVVGKDRQHWFEDKLNGVARVVALTAKQGAILSPYDCIDAIGPETLMAPKIAFSLGIETIFAETYLRACVDSRSIPVTRLGCVLKHFDAKDTAWFDYVGGGAAISDVHDAGLASIVFDAAWLKSKIQVRGLFWKDICKIAELEEQSVAECAQTALIANLKAYETILARGLTWSAPSIDVRTVVTLSASLKETVSDSIVVRRAFNEQVVCTNWTGKDILSEVKTLPPQEQWALALTLYKSVPMPSWLRGTVTFFRKLAGIK